jgi:hypothetical protein
MMSGVGKQVAWAGGHATGGAATFGLVQIGLGANRHNRGVGQFEQFLKQTRCRKECDLAGNLRRLRDGFLPKECHEWAEVVAGAA